METCSAFELAHRALLPQRVRRLGVRVVMNRTVVYLTLTAILLVALTHQPREHAPGEGQ